MEDDVTPKSKAKKKLSKRTDIGSSTASGLSSKADKQVNATKLVMIGIICGVLLAVAIILGLYVTGILSTLTGTTDDLATKSTPVVTEAATVATSDVSEPTAESEPSDSVAKDDDDVVKDSSSSTIAPVNYTNSDTEINDTKIKTKAADDATGSRQNIEPKGSNPAPETDISFEEFMQESQSTLYRESND